VSIITRLLVVFLLLIGILDARTHKDYSTFIVKAESSASPFARKVLSTARKMVKNRVVVRGSCWDYLNTAFSKAGFDKSGRKIIYRRPKRGPYVSVSSIQPGDWLYYINHSYGNIEHSGMFIGWINRSKKQGLILSYQGGHKNKPGRYRPYILSSVYQITRAQPR
jgi:hypothetical protein